MTLNVLEILEKEQVAFKAGIEYQKEKQDEYAIEFAEWYLNLWHTDDDSSFDNNSPQELLEIYKKEKGL